LPVDISAMNLQSHWGNVNYGNYDFYWNNVARWKSWMQMHNEAYWRTKNFVYNEPSNQEQNEEGYSASDDQLSVDYDAFEALRQFRQQNEEARNKIKSQAEAEIQLVDVRHANDNVAKASEKAPTEDTNYKMRQQRAEEMYGKQNSMRVLVLENEIEEKFQSFVDKNKPPIWPVIPFNL